MTYRTSRELLRPLCRLNVERLEDRTLLSSDMVLQWNDILLDAIRVDKTNPPKASRGMAIVHTSIYDAVNSIDGTHEPYLVDFSAPPSASLDAAVAVAAHTTLVYLYPAQKSTFDTKLAAALAGIPDGSSKNAGMWVGEGVADLIISARDGDGWDVITPYSPGSDPGDWQPTPPAYLPALLPNWPLVTPFCMDSGAAYRPERPPDLNSAEYRRAFREVFALGGVNSAIRTPEQTEIALFWADGAGTQTPSGHWNTIAHIVAESQGNTLVENARLFALLNMATADAGISSWDAKYAFNFWRPVTAIQASTDVTWLPLVTTPPFPSYTSGHSTFSSAAASVLATYFGTEYISFTIGSDGLPGVERSFLSFSEAAAEAGKSRIYGGIHWQFDNQEGLNAGYKIGEDVAENFLKEIPPAPAPGVRTSQVAGWHAFAASETFVNTESSQAAKAWHPLRRFLVDGTLIVCFEGTLPSTQPSSEDAKPARNATPASVQRPLPTPESVGDDMPALAVFHVSL